jgi:hypothetical protein
LSRIKFYIKNNILKNRDIKSAEVKDTVFNIRRENNEFHGFFRRISGSVFRNLNTEF